MARLSNVDFIFLLETKSQVSSLKPIFFKLGFPRFTGVNADRNNVGLFLCWSRRVVISVLIATKNIIACKTSDTASISYYVAFVYGSRNLPGRQQVWSNLTSLLTEHQGNWVLIGDFNQVENKDKKLGGSKSIKGAGKFLDRKLQKKFWTFLSMVSTTHGQTTDQIKKLYLKE